MPTRSQKAQRLAKTLTELRELIDLKLSVQLAEGKKLGLDQALADDDLRDAAAAIAEETIASFPNLIARVSDFSAEMSRVSETMEPVIQGEAARLVQHLRPELLSEQARSAMRREINRVRESGINDPDELRTATRQALLSAVGQADPGALVDAMAEGKLDRDTERAIWAEVGEALHPDRQRDDVLADSAQAADDQLRSMADAHWRGKISPDEVPPGGGPVDVFVETSSSGIAAGDGGGSQGGSESA